MKATKIPPDCNDAMRRLFWYWINERHEIQTLRSAGIPKPWTDDPILRDYKFTNVFRQLDTGTVWLRENLLAPNETAPMEQILFNVVVYRWFNWKGTGAALGWITKWNEKATVKLLKNRAENGFQVFTGAHIVNSEPGRNKIEDVCERLSWVWKDRHKLAGVATRTQSLEETFNALIQYKRLGGFLAYEMVSDLRWTRVLVGARDRYTWANPGPGCQRGLKRIWPGLPGREFLPRMRELYAEHRLNFPGAEQSPWPFEMREIEHSLCEFDKYARVKLGQGKPRSIYPGKG